MYIHVVVSFLYISQDKNAHFQDNSISKTCHLLSNSLSLLPSAPPPPLLTLSLQPKHNQKHQYHQSKVVRALHSLSLLTTTNLHSQLLPQFL